MGVEFEGFGEGEMFAHPPGGCQHRGEGTGGKVCCWELRFEKGGI